MIKFLLLASACFVSLSYQSAEAECLRQTKAETTASLKGRKR